jgi:hypothetical protein
MNFKNFIIEKKLTGYRAGSEDVGIIWLASTEKLAGEYSAHKDTPIHKYQFDLKNPFHIRKAELERSMREFIVSIINDAHRNGRDVKSVKDLAKRLMKINTGSVPIFKLWDKYYKELVELLTKLGYDGIQTTEGGTTTYGIFDRSKLKKV